ncbi:MAG: 4-hydroxybenzoate polyprenyltransferase [Chlamydiia bacterium]|nr:4-hydroxybenzoate polyprenyltransferase [Chlamydiia bacterium]
MNTKTLAIFNRLVQLKQSFFGLPWILAAILLPGKPCDFRMLSLLVLAFFAARLSGMCFNQAIDQYIDAKNPRTSSRPLQRKEISRELVFILATLSLLCFFVATYQINRTCFAFSPLIALLLIGYSYTKRFTWCCHFVLGAIQFFGPFLAWITVTGSFSFAALFFGLALGCSIAANDILYAFQDKAFDRREKLFSIPAIFGEKVARQIAAALRVATALSLLLVGVVHGASWIYFMGVCAVSFILYMTHSAEESLNKTKVFSLSNTYVAMILLVTVVLERVWRAL